MTFASVQPDGKILAGGYFTDIGGQTRHFLARLSNNTAALQELGGNANDCHLDTDGLEPALHPGRL